MVFTPRQRASAWTVPDVGTVVAGKYKVERECGRGGLAVVLAAKHLGLGHTVALKVLLPALRGDKETVERFMREGRAAAALTNEHAVRIFDVELLDDGAPFLVLEHLEGQDLLQTLAAGGPLPVDQAVDWTLQVCEAIAEAHAVGIVHRDIKPSNLFVTRGVDGAVCMKVIDFGLSRFAHASPDERCLTRPRAVMGSPHYMAPEQVKGLNDVDARVDIWALGAVLHECLVASPPFHAGSLPELFVEILTRRPSPVTSVRNDVPDAVAEAIARCLEREPSERFASVQELAKALGPYGSPRASLSVARIECYATPAERSPASSAPASAVASRSAAKVAVHDDAVRSAAFVGARSTAAALSVSFAAALASYGLMGLASQWPASVTTGEISAAIATVFPRLGRYVRGPGPSRDLDSSPSPAPEASARASATAPMQPVTAAPPL